MKVKDLIKELKKMPQDLEVGNSSFDCPIWAVGDWFSTVEHVVKKEIKDVVEDEDFSRMIKSLPNEFVVIRS